jgi:hypothetical protein
LSLRTVCRCRGSCAVEFSPLRHDFTIRRVLAKSNRPNAHFGHYDSVLG